MTSGKNLDHDLYTNSDEAATNLRAYQQVNSALDCIQAAQRLFDDAGAELCSVDGFATEWDSIRDLYFRTRKVWHAVDWQRANRIPTLPPTL